MNFQNEAPSWYKTPLRGPAKGENGRQVGCNGMVCYCNNADYCNQKEGQRVTGGPDNGAGLPARHLVGLLLPPVLAFHSRPQGNTKGDSRSWDTVYSNSPSLAFQKFSRGRSFLDILNRGISKRLFSRQFGRHRSTKALFPLHVSYLACIFIRSAEKSVQRWGR